MEHEVRRNKRLLAAALDDGEQKEAKNSIPFWQKRLREHIEANPELVRCYDREEVREAALQSPPNGGIIDGNTKAGGDGVHYICKIRREIYSCITQDIPTDEVIITDERIAHSNRHKNAFEKYGKYISQVLDDPGYIFADTRPNTGIVIGKITEGKRNLQIILRIRISSESQDYKNSVLSCWDIGDDRVDQYERNREMLYKKP